MTKAELIIDLKNLIGPAGKGAEVSNPGLTTWLNDAYMDCVAEIINTVPDYFTKLLKSSTIAGQSEYGLPTDFEKAVLVSISYDGTNYVRAVPLNNINQALDIQQSAVVHYDVSQPVYYIFKDTIGFMPTPGGTYSKNIKLWHAYSPTEMVEDTDEPDLPRRFHSILKFSAYANYLDQNDEHAAAEKMRQRFEAKLAYLVDQLSEQHPDRPRTVEVTDDDQGLYHGAF